MSQPPPRRDSLFPSTSIGRVQGTHIQRALSHESLSAHPLLSPNSPSSSSTTATIISPPSSISPAPVPKYVPYTPRQRTTPTSATAHPPVSASIGDASATATSKLQLMNLKAAAQGIGLDTGSVGWAVLERLVKCDNEVGGEWGDIWASVSMGKASLLLPLEQASSNEPITADFVKDHIVLCDGLSRDNAPIITLSGLRGTLVNQTLTFRSSISSTSPKFSALLNLTTRPSTLLTLPPLPLPTEISYPSYIVPMHTHTLPLPPRPSKPPLPARPNPNSRATSRFASLFGRNASPSPSTSTTTLSQQPSPRTDIPEQVVEVTAFTIDKKIVRKEVSKDINRAVKSDLLISLASSPVEIPSWLIDRVDTFTSSLYPFVKAPRPRKSSLDPNLKSVYVANGFVETPEEIAAMTQDFYVAVEHELKSRKDVEGEEKEKEVDEKRTEDGELREIMERVEKSICEVFYDRFFLIPSSDDLSHDEALSSRIAALNMLDLGLEHLDVNIGDAAERELDAVVKACGEKLTQLDLKCRSPAEKAAALVAAHKVVVDGLSQLPPIRLKSDPSSPMSPDLKTARQQTFPDVPNLNVHSVGPENLDSMVALDSQQLREVESPIELRLPETPVTILTSSTVPNHLPEHADTSPSLPEKPPPSDSRTQSPLPPVVPPPYAETVTPTPISGDILLPILIFAVVKSNPPHLVSHLLYTQRFRNQRISGEETYCLINLMAVAEFLENVDLGALGLGEGRVMSTADLTPIPIRSPLESPPLSGSLRGRVEHQVDIITGSANKVITGVVDSSFGVIRSLLPMGSPDPSVPSVSSVDAASAPWNSVRPGFGLLRRESGFSIASIAASIPGRDILSGTKSTGEESGQQLVTVNSRPASVKSGHAGDSHAPESDGSSDDRENGDDAEGEIEDGDEVGWEGGHDARSIRSFESMMSGKTKDRRGTASRKSLSDRLAHMSGLSRLGQPNIQRPSSPPSRRSSLLPPGAPSNRFDTPVSSRGASPIPLRLAPPIQRFMECSAEDIRVSEVGDLLREYRRLAEGVRAMGGFDD